MFGRVRKVKEVAQVTTISKLVGVLAGGSLGQKAVVTIGIAAIVFAVLKSLTWFALMLGGWLL